MTKTFLAQNKFNSDVHVPETSGSAGVHLLPPSPTPAAPIEPALPVSSEPKLPADAPTAQVSAGLSQLTPSCDVAGDSSPMHDEGTWEQRRALTNGDSLVLEPTLTGRGACDSAANLIHELFYHARRLGLPIDKGAGR